MTTEEFYNDELVKKMFESYWKLNIPWGLENKTKRLHRLDIEENRNLIEWLRLTDEIRRKYS